jgi:hypothetical protein
MGELAKAKGTVSQRKLELAAREAADRLTAGLDVPFMTAFEKFDAHMQDIDARQSEGAYTPDQARRRRESETEGMLAHAGIRRPEEEFRKSFEEITKLRDRGTITPEEFEKRRQELREGAVGEAANSIKTVSPVAAMAAGSKEAYSMMVNAQLNDPKVELARKTVTALDKIEQNTREKNKPANVLTP